MSLDYRSVYDGAKAELAKLREEKAEFERAIADRDQKIAALIQTMNALAPLVGEQPVADLEILARGMTDCIRTILAQADEPLSAAEIRDCLSEVGFKMESYSNPLATIHTILRRLTESAEVETTQETNISMPGGKKFAIAVSKGLGVEKIIGKDFEIGTMKGFIGVGRLRRSRKADQKEEK